MFYDEAGKYLLEGESMANIRIIEIPPGDAPENIRQAWVGLSLPLTKGQSTSPSTRPTWGVLTGPRRFLPQLSALIFKRYDITEGFAIDALSAVEILAKTHPEAAEWWRSEAAHVMKPKQKFIFPTSVCEVEE